MLNGFCSVPSLASSVSSSALLWALCQSQSAGIRIALDVNWRPTFWDENSAPTAGPSSHQIAVIQPLLNAASLLKLSKEEALWFFNTSDPALIQQALSQLPDVVVTDGAAPVSWQFGSQSGLQEPFNPLMLLTPQELATPSRLGCCTSGTLRHLNVSGSRLLVVPSFVLDPVVLIPNPRRFRLRLSWVR